ncbi:MAG TPA: FtsX-like permease family protein [Actinomycetota bacterium]|nr:FtsX-like permease family protein [Actinomycetota bacterium]
MATLRFLLTRFVAQRGLALAVVVTLSFAIGVLVSGPIYADAAREAIASATMGDAEVTVRNLRLTLYGGPGFDLAGADRAIAGALDALPISRLVREGVAAVRLTSGGRAASVPLLYRTGAGEHLAIQGEAPDAPGEIALPSSTARALRVRPGETVRATGPTERSTTLTVVGTFAPPFAGDPFWFGSQSPFPPPDSTAPQPALVAAAGWERIGPALGLTTRYAWDAYLDVVGRPFEELRTLPGRVEAAVKEVRASPGLSRVRTVTGLQTLVQLIEQRASDLRAPISLVVAQIAAVALAVLAGVGSLVVDRQAFELAVLHSRGFSRRALLTAQGVQGALAGALSLPLGLAVGAGLARLASRSNGPSLPGVLFPVRFSPLAVGLAAAGAAMGGALLLLLAVPRVGTTVVEERRALSREARPLLSRLPVELFVAPVAILAFVEARTGADRPALERTLDPLVLLAPTLLLVASSFLFLRGLLFVLRLLDGAVRRWRSLSAYLAARRLGRSPGTGSAASLLLVTAVGLLVVSTSYRAVVLHSHADAAHHRVGSDWNVRVAAPPGGSLAALAALPPGATGVVRPDAAFPGFGGSIPPEALAVDPATFRGAGWWRDDYADLPIEQLLERLDAPPFGVPLPNGAELRLDLTVPPPAARLELLASVLRSDRQVEVEVLGPLVPGRSTVTTGPIQGRGRLLSLTFRSPAGGDLPSAFQVLVHGVSADGSAVPIERWTPLLWRGSDGSVRTERGGVLVTVEPGAGDVVGGILPPSEPLPALAAPELAAELGPTFQASLGPHRVALRVVAEARAFPTITPGAGFAVVSAPALLERAAAVPEAGIALSEVWAAGGDPRSALRGAGLAVADATRAADIEAVMAQLPESLAVGMHFTAAVGGMVLVVIGVSVGLSLAQRRRGFEVAALRAMGARRREIAGAMALEQAVLLGGSVAAGGALGLLMLRLMMPSLGRELAAGFPPPVLAFDPTTLGAALALIAVATAFGLWVAVRAVLRASVTGALREEPT